MTTSGHTPLLSRALIALGLIFVFGIVILNRVWPSGWAWQPEQPAYLQMVLSLYVTLGIFLLRAARDPARHLSLIWFTVWSSVAHASVMAVHSVTDPGQLGHLWGDVAALLLTALVLTVLVRRELPAAGRP
ncbi:MAG TPA: DUF6632 domain-containing protein [Gemmatimonadales bacterium]|nr:DUF6632 domain-containing protein [Gemmatimonadales bacterium]